MHLQGADEETMTAQPHVIDKSQLPPLFPTHRHDPAFWCSLGRAVATFGFLEEMLKKTVFALTGTVPAPEDEAEAAAAVEAWGDLLERSVAQPLGFMITKFHEAAKHHPELSTSNIDEFVADLRAAAKVRNLICHGSWGAPDESGGSVPFYVIGRKRPEPPVVRQAVSPHRVMRSAGSPRSGGDQHTQQRGSREQRQRCVHPKA